MMQMGPGSDQDLYIDPRLNNEPLSFNANRGKPPMATDIQSSRFPDRKKSGDVDLGMSGMGAFAAKLLKIQKNDDDGHPMSMPPIPPSEGNMMMQGPGPQGFYPGPMGPPGMMGMMGPGPNPDMMMQGNMMMFGGMPQGNWRGPNNMQTSPLKEIIRTKTSVMYPPPPNQPPPTTRDRPHGCRTIFVGGLPETCTEEILSEVFQQFGSTTSVRKSTKKNFAHVRFDNESSVDRAMYISGYRMKVADRDDHANTGRLHVDFAMARDDQYEFECKQRASMRDMRHRQKQEEERFRPTSPPVVVQYVEYEAVSLTEKLKSDEDFLKASMVLLTWLERGDVSRRNINSFYSMIQCTNSHIRRLLTEKQTHEEDLFKMKEKFKNIFGGILRQLEQIEKVFLMAQKQRNWDHFTKAQRKNIELWLKQAKEIKQNQQEEFLSNRQEDEMEMSDDDEGPSASKKPKRPEVNESMTNQYVEMAGKLNQINMLKDENEELKCQIEVFKNELAVLKQENNSSSTDRDKEFKSLQFAMQGMQQQLITARSEMTEYKQKVEQEKAILAMEKQATSDKMDKLQRELNEASKDGSKESSSQDKGGRRLELEQNKVADDTITSTGVHFTHKEAKLLGLVCCFLHVHPTGASIDYIWSYLHRLGLACKVGELETLLDKLPVLFRQEVSGVGATIERRWHFTGYKSLTALTASDPIIL